MRVPAAQPRFLRQKEASPAEAPRPPVTDGAAARGAPPRPRLTSMWLVLAGCLAVAAPTLILPTTPTYDPWAWILWGREIAHLDLVTNGGPSWKPLPILFTTPFSVFGLHTA